MRTWLSLIDEYNLTHKCVGAMLRIGDSVLYHDLKYCVVSAGKELENISILHQLNLGKQIKN